MFVTMGNQGLVYRRWLNRRLANVLVNQKYLRSPILQNPSIILNETAAQLLWVPSYCELPVHGVAARSCLYMYMCLYVVATFNYDCAAAMLSETRWPHTRCKVPAYIWYIYIPFGRAGLPDRGPISCILFGCGREGSFGAAIICKREATVAQQGSMQNLVAHISHRTRPYNKIINVHQLQNLCTYLYLISL